MENKYQKELDLIENCVYGVHVDYSEIREAIDTMYILSRKNTPKPVKMIGECDVANDRFVATNSCPVCETKVITGHYCINCGQALKWGDSNE